MGSTVAREADHVLYTWAGPEIAVASTKTFVSQLMVFYVMAAHLAEKMGYMSQEEQSQYLMNCWRCRQGAKADRQRLSICRNGEEILYPPQCFLHRTQCGRCIGYGGGLETQRKFPMCNAKRIAGELHGTLSLVEDGTLVYRHCHADAFGEIRPSTTSRANARFAARICAIAMEGDMRLDKEVQEVWEIPACPEIMAPALVAIPTQLFGYYMLRKGCDIDKPRNLAKSVTVE